MTGVKTRNISRDEKMMILTLNSKSLQLILAGFIVSTIVLAIILGTLNLFARIYKQANSFILPNSHIVFFSIFLIIFGSLSAKLKAVQYALHKAAFRGSSLFDVIASGTGLIFPMAIFAFIFIMQITLKSVYAVDPWSTSTLYVVTGIFSTIVITQLWNFFFNNSLVILTSVDWKLIVDKERFSQTLRLRFDESKRYPGPFTLMIIEIKNYVLLIKNHKKRKVIHIQENIISFINHTLRTVDLVARIEDGRYIGVLLHTSIGESKIPAQRILELAKDISISVKGESVNPQFFFSIAAFEQPMQHERELFDKAKHTMARATEEHPIVTA